MSQQRNNKSKKNVTSSTSSSSKKDSIADCKVVVSNLDYSTMWSTLRDSFAHVGIVEYAKIYTKHDGISTGRGYVQFKSAKKAKQAVEEMNGKEIEGREVVVKLYNSTEVSPRSDNSKLVM